MQYIPVQDTASFELIYDVFGQKCENVFHVYKLSGWTADDLDTYCATFEAWWSAYGKARVHSGVSLGLIVAKDLSSQTAPAIEYASGLPISGTYPNGTDLPLNVTVAVSFGTNLRGRSYRGRIYQVGMTSDMIVDNQITVTFKNSLLTAYNDLVARISQTGGDLVVVSRFHNKAPRSVGVTTPITRVSVDVNLDSQRRRLTGRGK